MKDKSKATKIKPIPPAPCKDCVHKNRYCSNASCEKWRKYKKQYLIKD